MFNSKKNLKMISAGLAAVMMVLTMAGCSSPETGDASKADVKEKTSSTAAEESSEETAGGESAAEESVESEVKEDTESSEASAVTTSPDDFDLDAMIASIEAEIPDITAYSGIDIDIDPTLEDTSSTAEAGTTTKPEANAPAAADLTSYQQFSFDGMTYDNANILDSAVTVPSGWEDKGRSSKDYKNTLYPDYDIVVSDKVVQFIKTRDEGGDKPSLKLYKGLTWGASVADIKAAYGEPVHEGSSDQYGTAFTNMFYKDSDGLLIIYQVSSDWGLAGIICEGKN